MNCTMQVVMFPEVSTCELIVIHIYVLRKVGIGTILELSCAKWEFSLCCAIPEW